MNALNPVGKKFAYPIYNHIAACLNNNRISLYSSSSFLNSLATLHPAIFLDCFIDEKNKEPIDHKFHYFTNLERHENPFNQIPDEVITSWCNDSPEKRCIYIAHLASLFRNDEKLDHPVWKPFIHYFVGKLKNPEPLLECMSDSIVPRGWSGSLADILEKRSVLYKEFFNHKNSEVSSWATSQYSILREKIIFRREYESQKNREKYEAFE